MNNAKSSLGVIRNLKVGILAPRFYRRLRGIKNCWTRVQGIKPTIFNKGDLPMIRFIGRAGLENKTILDLGCGDCSFIDNFQIDKSKYKGFDINKTEIKKAKSKGYNVFKINLDKTRLDFPKENFDVVIIKDVLEHLNNPLQVVKEASKVLKKDGSIFILVPSEWSQLIWDDYNHKRGFTKRAVSELIEDAGFKIIKIKPYQDLIKFKTSRLKYPMRLLFKLLTGIDLIIQGYMIEAKK